MKSFFDLNIDVLHAGTGNRYVDEDDIWLVNLVAIVLFSNFKLKVSSGKHLENIYHAPIVSLKYKLISSATGCDDLSIGFDRDHKRRQQDLTNNKNHKGKYHFRIHFKDVFGFCEYQEKATYG